MCEYTGGVEICCKYVHATIIIVVSLWPHCFNIRHNTTKPYISLSGKADVM